MSFDTDKNAVYLLELELMNFLATKLDWMIAAKPQGYVPECDFTYLKKGRVEVKCDFEAVRFGNLFLEIRNPKSGKATGLTSTEADTWLHFVPPDRVFLFTPRHMRIYCEKNNIEKKVVFNGNSEGYTIPIKTVEELIARKTFWVKEHKYNPMSLTQPKAA